MAEKLEVSLTLNWTGKIMDVMTTDGVIDAYQGSGQTFTSSSIESIVNDEIRFYATVSDNYEIDTVTNTNEHFVIKCITDSSFIYTWADSTFHADIIDTITITTRYKEDTPEIGPNSNLNIDTLANTKWEFTNYPETSYLYLISNNSDISLYDYIVVEVNCKWNGNTYKGFYTDQSTQAGDVLLFDVSNGWAVDSRIVEVIDGAEINDYSTIEWFKNNATLVSGGDSGESGDEPESGDTPSTPTIGPNAQLTEFLTGIADAIREKTGTSDLINPQDFATTIAEMQTGGNVESNPDEMLKAMVEGTMLTLNVSTISSIGSNAFANSFLIDVNLPTCTSIGTSAFVMCSNMIRFSAPLCTRLDNYAFQSCYALAHFNMPNLSYIGYGAFNNCNNFTLCSFPKCSYVGQLAFAYTKITKINLPQCTSLSTQAFAFCHNLVSVNSEDLPLITELRNTFTQCSNLTYVSLPNVTSISGAFYECSKLETAFLPNCSRLEYGAFSRCSNLINVTATACESVSAYAFNTCYKLPSISLPKCSYIGSRAFYQCSALSKLYLMSTAVVSLYNTQALSYTPMSSSSYLGYFGSIYVPTSLLASYKTATYWSVFSSRFVGV